MRVRAMFFARIFILTTMANILAGFNLDLSRATDSLIDWARLDQNRTQFNEQQKEQKARTDYSVSKDLSNYAPTGTVWDDIGSKLASEIQQEYIKVGKENPNATYAQKAAKVYPKVVQLAKWGNEAKQRDAEIKAMQGMVDKEHPWVDRSKFDNLAYKKAFYGEDGKVLPVPNRNWQEGLDINDINVANQIANREAIPLMEQKQMKSLYQPNEVPVMGDGVSTPDAYFSAYPYQRPNPKDNTVGIAGQKLRLGGSDFGILDEQAAEYIPKGMSTRIALADIQQELSQNPNFEGLSPQLQDLAVKHKYLERYGQSEKTGLKKLDSTRMTAARQLRNEERAIKQQAISNALAASRENRENEKWQDKKMRAEQVPVSDYEVKREAIKLKDGQFEDPKMNEFAYQRFAAPPIDADMNFIVQKGMKGKEKNIYDKAIANGLLAKQNPFDGWESADLTAGINDGFAKKNSGRREGEKEQRYTLRIYKDPNTGAQYLVKAKYLIENKDVEGNAIPARYILDPNSPRELIPEDKWQYEVDLLHRQDKTNDKQFSQMGGNQPEE